MINIPLFLFYYMSPSQNNHEEHHMKPPNFMHTSPLTRPMWSAHHLLKNLLMQPHNRVSYTKMTLIPDSFLSQWVSISQLELDADFVYILILSILTQCASVTQPAHLFRERCKLPAVMNSIWQKPSIMAYHSRLTDCLLPASRNY